MQLIRTNFDADPNWSESNVQYRHLLSDGENGGGRCQMVQIVGDGLMMSDDVRRISFVRLVV